MSSLRWQLVRLRMAIERALGLEHEWRLVRRRGFYIARCRWCGLYKAHGHEDPAL